MYGVGVPSALSTLSAHSSQLAAMARWGVLEPFWASVRYSPVAAWVDCGPWLPGAPGGAREGMPLLFWREALAEVCHRMGTGLVKEKPLLELLERLARSGARHDGFITVRTRPLKTPYYKWETRTPCPLSICPFLLCR